MSMRDLLSGMEQVRQVGEADSLQEALKTLKTKEVDLLILDVELGDGTGFDLLEQLDKELAVIFVTHHEDFALRAFEVAAVDYLRKPVTATRLLRALNRCHLGVAVSNPEPESLSPQSLLCLTDGPRRYFLRVGEIIYVQADEKYTKVRRQGRSELLCRKSMRSWEEELPGNLFCRIHRSLIVNLEQIDYIETPGDRSGLLYFKGGGEGIVLNRSALERFRGLFPNS